MSEDDAAFLPMERHSVGLIDTRRVDAWAPRDSVDVKPRVARIVGEELHTSRDRLAESPLFLASRPRERFGDVYFGRP
jgi:hypothetical protein